jgi:hypothetical protein
LDELASANQPALPVSSAGKKIKSYEPQVAPMQE